MIVIKGPIAKMGFIDRECKKKGIITPTRAEIFITKKREKLNRNDKENPCQGNKIRKNVNPHNIPLKQVIRISLNNLREKVKEYILSFEKALTVIEAVCIAILPPIESKIGTKKVNITLSFKNSLFKFIKKAATMPPNKPIKSHGIRAHTDFKTDS